MNRVLNGQPVLFESASDKKLSMVQKLEMWKAEKQQREAQSTPLSSTFSSTSTSTFAAPTSSSSSSTPSSLSSSLSSSSSSSSSSTPSSRPNSVSSIIEELSHTSNRPGSAYKTSSGNGSSGMLGSSFSERMERNSISNSSSNNSSNSNSNSNSARKNFTQHPPIAIGGGSLLASEFTLDSFLKDENAIHPSLQSNRNKANLNVYKPIRSESKPSSSSSSQQQQLKDNSFMSPTPLQHATSSAINIRNSSGSHYSSSLHNNNSMTSISNITKQFGSGGSHNAHHTGSKHNNATSSNSNLSHHSSSDNGNSNHNSIHSNSSSSSSNNNNNINNNNNNTFVHRVIDVLPHSNNSSNNNHFSNKISGFSSDNSYSPMPSKPKPSLPSDLRSGRSTGKKESNADDSNFGMVTSPDAHSFSKSNNSSNVISSSNNNINVNTNNVNSVNSSQSSGVVNAIANQLISNNLINGNNAATAVVADNSQRKLIEDLKGENHMLKEQTKLFAEREANYNDTIARLQIQLEQMSFYKNKLEYFAEEAHSVNFLNSIQEQKINELENTVLRLKSDQSSNEKVHKYKHEISILLKEKAEYECKNDEMIQQMTDQMSQLQAFAMSRIDMLEKELIEERHRSAEQKASSMKSSRAMQQYIQQPPQTDNVAPPTQTTRRGATPPRRESSSRLAAKANKESKQANNNNNSSSSSNQDNDLDVWASHESSNSSAQQGASGGRASSSRGRRCSSMFAHNHNNAKEEGPSEDVLMNIEE